MIDIRLIRKDRAAVKAKLPNLHMDEIKVSPDRKDNVNMKEVGLTPHFDFPFKNHLELSELLNLFDCKRGAKISGAGFAIYRGMRARLEWALNIPSVRQKYFGEISKLIRISHD